MLIVLFLRIFEFVLNNLRLILKELFCLETVYILKLNYVYIYKSYEIELLLDKSCLLELSSQISVKREDITMRVALSKVFKCLFSSINYERERLLFKENYLI